MTRLDGGGLDAYTDRFTDDALRFESLSFYDVDSDGDAYQRWLAGEPAPSPGTWGSWAQWVRAQLDRGATVRRLRVLHAEPTDYLRFEMAWGYTANVVAGEDIRVLDLTHRGLRGVAQVPVEFWMMDRARFAVMTYDHGKFVHADAVEDEPAASEWPRVVQDLWAVAESFSTWWERHPQYHGATARV